MQDEGNSKLSKPVSSQIVVAALVAATMFGGWVGYQVGAASGTAGAWNELKRLGSSAAQAAPEQGAYSQRDVRDCQDGVSRDPSIDCEAVLASLPEPRTTFDMAIAAVRTVDTSCPSPTTRDAGTGDCILTSDAVLTETLWLSSGTTLDCQGHRMAPSVDGQSGGLGSNPQRRPLQAYVPSVPNTAVLLAGDTSGVTVKNCVIENFDFGVVIANSKIADAAKTGGGNLITGNTLNNRYRGVQILASDDNRIVDNQIHSFAVASAGIIIGHDADDNVIKGNTYVGPSSEDWGPAPLFPGDEGEVSQGWIGEAVVVQGPVYSYNFKVGSKTFRGTNNPQGWAERNIIEDNDVDLANGWGTAIMSHSASDGTVMRGNTVRRADVALRAVNCCDTRYANSRNVLMEGNTILGPAWVGLYAASTDNAVIRNNKVSNMGEAGIRVIFHALRSATITKNLVTDSTVALDLFTMPPNDPFNAKIFDNDFIADEIGVTAYLGAPAELSFEGKGNYWGHSEAPAFRATDASDPSLVTDSYASLVPLSGLLDD